MWIFCCGMYRSGSTFQYQITAHLVEEFKLGQRLGWVEPNKFPKLYEQYRSNPKLKVIKTHQCTELMATELKNNTAKAVYIYRNLVEVYISRMEQTSKSFETLWEEGFLEDCLQHHQHWTHLPNVLVSQYELVTENLSEEVQRIADHLGIKINQNQKDKIAQSYSKEQQVKRIKTFKNNLLAEKPFLKTEQSIFAHYDTQTLLHPDHISSMKRDKIKV